MAICLAMNSLLTAAHVIILSTRRQYRQQEALPDLAPCEINEQNKAFFPLYRFLPHVLCSSHFIYHPTETSGPSEMPSIIGFAPVLTKEVSREASWALTSQQARQGVDGSHS